MTLDKNTKHEVSAGDILRFPECDFIVKNVIPGFWKNALSFTVQDAKTGRVIYCHPSSELYGAEIIKSGK